MRSESVLMNKNDYNRSIRLEPMHLADEAEVDRLLDKLTRYSMLVDGVPKMRDGARHLLTATPPGKTAEDKHVFKVVYGADTVGIVDIIKDYPRSGVAFIGLLAIAEDRHRQGLGRETYQAVEALAQQQMKASIIRLAIVDTNPVEGFWERMGFGRTGEVSPYTGEAVVGNAVLMEKALR